MRRGFWWGAFCRRALAGSGSGVWACAADFVRSSTSGGPSPPPSSRGSTRAPAAFSPRAKYSRAHRCWSMKMPNNSPPKIKGIPFRRFLENAVRLFLPFDAVISYSLFAGRTPDYQPRALALADSRVLAGGWWLMAGVQRRRVKRRLKELMGDPIPPLLSQLTKQVLVPGSRRDLPRLPSHICSTLPRKLLLKHTSNLSPQPF